MSVATEARHAGEQQPFPAKSMGAAALLRARGATLRLCRDGSCSWLRSESEDRLVFGKEAMYFYKLQQGVKIRAGKVEWRPSLWPDSASIGCRLFETLDVRQSFAVRGGNCISSIRRVTLSNSGASQIRVRVISVHDTTAVHSDAPKWGSMGVNAFNRSSHVAMDEVAGPGGCRVIGSSPPPATIYMTSDPTRATDIVQRGELPDTTAGMSGQIIVMTQRDFELSPGESSEAVYISVYSSERLEDSLSEFNRLTKDSCSPFLVGCAYSSDPSLAAALGWARSVVLNAEFERDVLDRAEALTAIAVTDEQAALRAVQSLISEVRKEGSLPHSSDRSQPGVLETAVFLAAASLYCSLSADKKYVRSLYSPLRRAAQFLMVMSEGEMVQTGASLPHGWRRRLGRGYPTFVLPEVNLAVVSALLSFSSVAGRLSKGKEAALYRERAELILSNVKRRLVLESGDLALNLDEKGVVHTEVTADQAVALYRHQLDENVSSGTVHRLLEKDFETGYGPRTVPTSNGTYFNSSYGEGQIGGYWTRAALSHALVAYRSGLSGIGSLILSRVSRLVAFDAPSFGATPGTVPYWVNVEKREFGSEESDPVAAARLLEAAVFGELGLRVSSGGPVAEPPSTSSIGWLLIDDILRQNCTVFVGRSGRVKLVVVSLPLVPSGGVGYQKCEKVQSERPLVVRVFHGPGQGILVCNTGQSPASGTVSFQPRDARMLKSLSVWLEEMDQTGGEWKRVQQLRVLQEMSFQASLRPLSWRFFRLTTS